MAAFGDLVKKAFYLGVGVASYAAEKAGSALPELKVQAQKLADEMVARGEITAEEAKRMVDEMISRAQQPSTPSPDSDATPTAPREIEILEAEEVSDNSEAEAVEKMRDEIAKLQEELKRLQREE